MSRCLLAACLGLLLVSPAWLTAAELWVGAATVDITPAEPVALDGQRRVRISRKADTPIYATALALESRAGGEVVDQAVMVACDLVAIRQGILEMVRQKLPSRVEGFDPSKLFLSATHTHTAPVTTEGRYVIPSRGVMQPAAYAEWLTDRIADAVAESWQQRQPGRVGWGQSHAVIAQNRRAVYENGTAVMYGATNNARFRGIEGYEDHSLDVLYFWDQQNQLLATAINVPCPAQEVGGQSSIHADFWHPVRETLRQRHGPRLHVLAWTGAAGDQAPRPMFGTKADERMRRLRGLTRLEELSRRIVHAWEDAYEAAQLDVHDDIVFRHAVKRIELPYRQVTEAEVAQARLDAARYANDPAEFWNYRWNRSVIDRYEAQQAGTQGNYTMELHALRLGDVAIATNEFELFTDFGIQMKARSPAVQTFLIQLAGPGTYLPSERAVRGGGYSAVIQSSHIGPDGGQALVEQTLHTWHTLWPEP